MDMREKLMELHSKGYNCGQIICAVLGEELGWDESTPEALANMCESCGQISPSVPAPVPPCPA